MNGDPTSRWTGAAVGCFLTSLVRRRLNVNAPPGQLHRYTACLLAMDLRNQELHFIGNVTSIEGTLNRADSLIRLAESNPDSAKTLAACATIVLAIALEQGIQTILSESAETSSFEDAVEVSNTRAMPFYKRRNDLWFKVLSLPALVSEDRFHLDDEHRLTRSLKQLIDMRNKLVHVNEPSIHIVTPDDRIRIENDRAIVQFEVPMSAWQTITLEHVKRFREAVLAYNREVLFPDEGNIVVGNLVYETT